MKFNVFRRGIYRFNTLLYSFPMIEGGGRHSAYHKQVRRFLRFLKLFWIGKIAIIVTGLAKKKYCCVPVAARVFRRKHPTRAPTQLLLFLAFIVTLRRTGKNTRLTKLTVLPRISILRPVPI